MHLCMIRVVDNTNIGGGPEEQQELEHDVTDGAREEREECARKDDEGNQAARPEAGLSPARPAMHPKLTASNTQEGRPQPGLGRAGTRGARPQPGFSPARPVWVPWKSQPGLDPASAQPGPGLRARLSAKPTFRSVCTRLSPNQVRFLS